MFSYLSHELSLLQYLSQFRHEMINPIIQLMHHLDKGYTYTIIGIFTLTIINPKLGKRLFILFGLVFVSNYFLKSILQQPRPFILDSSLGLAKTNSLYGLPSGAAQAATAMLVFFYYHFPKKKILIFGLLYLSMICFSRVYIGVHFITDVVAGSLIGFLLAKFYLRYIDFVEEKATQWSSLTFIALCILTGVAMRFSDLVDSYQFGFALIIGFIASGKYFDTIDWSSRSISQRVSSFGLGVALYGTFGVFSNNTLLNSYELSLVLIASLVMTVLFGFQSRKKLSHHA